MMVAELLIALGNVESGVAIEIVLVFALVSHGALVLNREPTLGFLLIALCLAPLDRTLSVAVPSSGLPTLAWLAIVSAPLLLAVGSVAYVQGMRFGDLGLSLPTLKAFPLQLGIALTGIPLGLTEYFILRPGDWLPGGFLLMDFLGGVLVLLVATGVAEEVLFRGILLQRATKHLGILPGLLFATVAFTLMHLFYNSLPDLVFVFAVGLFYGVLVLRTENLWGVILSHTFDNVILYLVAPFLILPHLGL